MTPRSAKTTARCAAALLLAMFGAGHLARADGPEQARRLRRIPTPERPLEERLAVDFDAPLPDVVECVDAVRRIAAAYATPALEPLLDPSFPNRAELLDALARADVRVTNLELLVESVEYARFGPWYAAGPEGTGVATDCVAQVRTRFAFDLASSGERVIGDVSVGEWRVRFARSGAAESEVSS